MTQRRGIRRSVILLMALGMLVGSLTGVSAAHEEVPPHGHILVLGIEFDDDFNVVSYRRCVDLAGGRVVPNHHATVHMGRAGEALWNAGHATAPTDPLWPGLRNCADFVRMVEAGEI